ncbi:MAG TPA: hypothetical protein VFM88_15815 [Vicinamibacteria bacterium]|nr:hypothetical protein [Vicinamibacteria bacterium]
METSSQQARCVNCRTEIAVPSTYAHGDHIKCGACGTKHKVVRGDVLRLVMADVAPLRESLQHNRQVIERLEAEMYAARASFGIGANGIGLGVAYLLWQVGFENRLLGRDVFLEAVGVAAACGVVLELANYFFLAKRQKMRRLANEISEAQKDGRAIEQKIREASRV